MPKDSNNPLSRREREIMDVIYRAGRASAAEVLDQLTDPPSYSAVRALLRVLEDKGHLRHEEDGPRYVFLPTVPRERARRSEEHTSELQSPCNLVCRLLLEKKNNHHHTPTLLDSRLSSHLRLSRPRVAVTVFLQLVLRRPPYRIGALLL